MDVDYSPSNLMCALAPLEVHHRPSSGCIDPDLLGLLNKIPRTPYAQQEPHPQKVTHVILARTTLASQWHAVRSPLSETPGQCSSVQAVAMKYSPSFGKALFFHARYPSVYHIPASCCGSCISSELSHKQLAYPVAVPNLLMTLSQQLLLAKS